MRRLEEGLECMISFGVEEATLEEICSVGVKCG
jgi:hypothetical protein